MLMKSPSQIRPAVPALMRRSLDNLRDTFRIVRRRLATRPPRYPRIPWPAWALVWLLTTLAVGFRFDYAAGEMLGRWPPGFVSFTMVLTVLGLGGWYLIPSALVLLVANLTDWRGLSRRSRMVAYNWTSFALLVLGSIAVSALVVNVLKYGMGRARPMNFHKLGDLSLHPFAMDARFASFPSGHACTMGVIFGLAMMMLPQRKWLLLAFTLSVASTRIFVGAHYPSDTVAGFGLGCAVAVACALVATRLGFIFRHRTAGLPVPKITFHLFRRSGKPHRGGVTR